MVEVTFRGDIGTVTDPAAWSAQFITDISAAIGVSPARVEVVELKAGSIIVTFKILPAADAGGAGDGTAIPEPSARDAVSALEDQLDNDTSALQRSLSFSMAGGVESYTVVSTPGRLTNLSWSSIIGCGTLLLCCVGVVGWTSLRSSAKMKELRAEEAARGGK
eukprot:SAG22_NODE_8357_length_662_cov_0.511545_1_plen_162_part_10